MPILAPNAPPLLGLPQRFESGLPPSVVQGTLNPVFAALTDASFGASHLSDADQLAGLVGRAVSTSTGWPEAQIDSLAAIVVASLKAIQPADVAKVLAGKLAADVFADLQETIGSMVGGAPIVGWVVQLGQLAYNLVKIARFRAPEITSLQALAYDSAGDNFGAAEISQRTGADDWTAFFRPNGGKFALADLAYTAAGAKGGIAFGQLNVATSESLGLLPGLAQIAGYWQTPRKVPGSTRDAGLVDLVSNAQLLPSTITLSGVMWNAAQSAGPMLARLDLHELAEAWRDYGEAFEEFAEAQDGWTQGQILNAWRWTDPNYGAPLYGIERDTIPAEYRGWGLQNLVAYQLERARGRVRDNMKTLACAYVAPGAPGLSDVPTREQWTESRKLLLLHPARMDVDASIIPDADYRNAMVLAQQLGATDLAPGTGGGPKKPTKIGAVLDKFLGRAPQRPIASAIPFSKPTPEGVGLDVPPALGIGVVAAIVIWLLAR